MTCYNLTSFSWKCLEEENPAALRAVTCLTDFVFQESQDSELPKPELYPMFSLNFFIFAHITWSIYSLIISKPILFFSTSRHLSKFTTQLLLLKAQGQSPLWFPKIHFSPLYVSQDKNNILPACKSHLQVWLLRKEEWDREIGRYDRILNFHD